jgi:hypothetical protein
MRASWKVRSQACATLRDSKSAGKIQPRHGMRLGMYALLLLKLGLSDGSCADGSNW